MKRRVSMLLAIMILLQFIFAMPVLANDTVMIRPLLDVNTKTYKVELFADKPTWRTGHEAVNRMSFSEIFLAGSLGQAEVSRQKDLQTSGNGIMDSYDGRNQRKNPSAATSLDNEFGYGGYMEMEGYKDGSTLELDDSKGKDENASTHPFAANSAKPNTMFPLNFPGAHSGAKDATALEQEYAIKVGSNLSANLNQMLITVNGNKRFASVKELVNKSIMMRPTSKGYTIVPKNAASVSNNGYIILYGEPGQLSQNDSAVALDAELVVTKGMPDSSKLIDGEGNSILGGVLNSKDFFQNQPIADADGNLLAYVIPIKVPQGDSAANTTYGGVNWSDLNLSAMSTFVWAMPKGYMKIDSGTPLKFSDGANEFSWIKQGQDVPWITIHHLTMYANTQYKNHNITLSTQSTGDVDVVSAVLLSLVGGLVSGMQTLMGLSDTFTLVFNRGLRASSDYNFGAMSDGWWAVVLRYHLIFQGIAWFIIICGVIKMLIELNLSTVNPGRRMSVYEQLSKFILVGFLLVTIIPIIQFMLELNSSIVGIFATQVDPNSNAPPVASGLAGLFLQMCFFAIAVYINFVYIMRSIVIGILTVTAPFFISTMTFFQKKDFFVTWGKELIANIFMQSIHAFSLAFLFNLVQTGGGLESIVISYSIIPITELIRSLVFQGGGAATEGLGKAAGQKYVGAARAVGRTAMEAGAGTVNSAMQGRENPLEMLRNGGAKGAGGARTQTPSTDATAAKLNSKIEGMKGGGVASTGTAGEDGGKMKSGFNQQALAGLGGAAMGTMSAIGGLASTIMDISEAELSGKPTDYRDIGARGAGAAVSGIRGGVSAGGAVKNAYKAANVPKGGSTSNAISPTEVTQDATGNNIARYRTADIGGGSFSDTGDGRVSRNFSRSDFTGGQMDLTTDTMAQAAHAYMNSDAGGRQSIALAAQNQGFSMAGTSGGGVSITPDKQAMNASGIKSQSVSQDGKNFFSTSQSKTVSGPFSMNLTNMPIPTATKEYMKQQPPVQDRSNPSGEVAN